MMSHHPSVSPEYQIIIMKQGIWNLINSQQIVNGQEINRLICMSRKIDAWPEVPTRILLAGQTEC